MHSTAAGEGLLSAVQNHKDNLTLRRYADAGAAMTGNIIRT